MARCAVCDGVTLPPLPIRTHRLEICLLQASIYLVPRVILAALSDLLGPGSVLG
jgi:hypothetical protein